jgi:hypothetical protein
MNILERMRMIGDQEFGYLITSSFIELNKLRFILIDGSFIEIFISQEHPGRYAFHWERRHIDKTIYRHDNIPHNSWKSISSFPWHYHTGSEFNVIDSNFTEDMIANLRKFLLFVRKMLDNQ